MEPFRGKGLQALPAKVAGSLAIDAPNSLFLPPNTDLDAFYITDDSGPRSLLMLAARYGAPECANMLLQAGASPNLQAPDGATALHCACGNAVSSRAARVIAVLLRHGADRTILDNSFRLPSDLLALAPSQGAAEWREMGNHQHAAHQTDDFRIFSFKIETCPRLGELHDWNDCPYLHPGEKARRRDPRVFTYQAVACPDFRKGSCRRGDGCPFAHGVFECWLHPDRYRTQLCKEGAACTRAVCFFAHTVDQLRDPPTTLPPLNTGARDGCKGPGSQPASPGSTLQPGALTSTSNGTSRCASPPAAHGVALAFGPLHRTLSVDTTRSGDSSAGSTPPLGCPITAALAQARQQAEHQVAAAAAAANVRALQQKQSAAAAAAASALQQVLLAKAAANWPSASAAPQHGNSTFGNAPHSCFPTVGGPAAFVLGVQPDPWTRHLDAAPTVNAVSLGRSASAPVSVLHTSGAAEAGADAAAAVQQLLAGLEL